MVITNLEKTDSQKSAIAPIVEFGLFVKINNWYSKKSQFSQEEWVRKERIVRMLLSLFGATYILEFCIEWNEFWSAPESLNEN